MIALKNSERGFTLLEMLLALTLISSAAFVLMIKLPGYAEQQKLTLAAEQLLGEIRDARQAALAENNSFRIRFSAGEGGHSYQIFRQNTLVKEIQLGNGVKFTAMPSSLTFNALGRGAGATVTLQNAAGERKSIIVSPVGMRIRAE